MHSCVDSVDTAAERDRLKCLGSLEKYVPEGAGIVVFHAANNAFLEWAGYNLDPDGRAVPFVNNLSGVSNMWQSRSTVDSRRR